VKLSLVLTHDCNLGCTYCYAGKKFRSGMATATIDAALRWGIDHLQPQETFGLCYFGGEPLLQWEQLVYASTQAAKLSQEHDLRLVQSVTTNGTLLTSERIQKLHQLGIYIALSIDGNQQAHDQHRPTMGGQSSWSEVSQGLDRLIEACIPFETISVVTPDNIIYLSESIEELFERGVDKITLNPCFEMPWNEEQLRHWEQALFRAAQLVISWYRRGRTVAVSNLEGKILARIKGGLEAQDKCRAGLRSFAIAPSGNIFACERLVGEDNVEDDVIGHLDHGLFSNKIKSLCEQLPDHHAHNEECGTCVERDRCTHHCACANRAETGNPGRAGGVQCWIEQTTMRFADELTDILIQEQNPSFIERYQLQQAQIPAAQQVTHSIPRSSKHHLPVLNQH
jgi:uncharacterized protein